MSQQACSIHSKAVFMKLRQMIELSTDVLKHMSKDQLCFITIHQVPTMEKWIKSGHQENCGPQNHAHWLTLAIRIMICDTRMLKPTQKLVKLTKYIVRVYSPTWFRIKGSSCLTKTLEIVLELINRHKDLNYPDISRIVKKNIQNNTYALLPENFIYSLVCNDDY